jgi:hypothetical protein
MRGGTVRTLYHFYNYSAISPPQEAALTLSWLYYSVNYSKTTVYQRIIVDDKVKVIATLFFRSRTLNV